MRPPWKMIWGFCLSRAPTLPLTRRFLSSIYIQLEGILMAPRAGNHKTVRGSIVCEGQWGPPVLVGGRARPPAASQALPLLWGEQAGVGEADQPSVQSKPSDCGPVCFPGYEAQPKSREQISGFFLVPFLFMEKRVCLRVRIQSQWPPSSRAHAGSLNLQRWIGSEKRGELSLPV